MLATSFGLNRPSSDQYLQNLKLLVHITRQYHGIPFKSFLFFIIIIIIMGSHYIDELYYMHQQF
jgi:hypothetical protein